MQNNPLSLKHIKILRLSLVTCGAWPSELFGDKSRRKLIILFLIVLSCFNISAEMNYISKKFNILPFFDLGDIYMTLFLSILTLVRAFLPTFKNYGELTKAFVMEFHLMHFKHRGAYYEMIYHKTNTISHYFTLLMVVNSSAGPIFFNLVPLYNNFMNGVGTKHQVANYTVQFSVYYLYPWYDQNDHYISASILNLYLSYYCGVFVCILDLLMSLMAFQIIGHIKTLIHDLRHIPRPKHPVFIEMFCQKTKTHTDLSVDTYDVEENKFIREKIIEFVDHHRLIVRFAESVSDVFGPMLALTYLYQLISCALLLLECSQLDPAALARYGPLTVIIYYELVQISFTFEVIGSESDKLKDEVYYIPWECMNKSNQRLLWIFLHRIQTPIRVTGLGMVEVGVQAMVGILKTTFSYFALLKSMNE